jgi:molybdate transport system ATP-binding protein
MKLSASIQARLSRGFALDVRLAAPPGITMVFGESGSGKSTLLRCLAGLHRPDAGRIQIGDAIVFDAAQQIDVPTRRRSIGYVFQHLALFPHMTIAENIAFGLADVEPADGRARTDAIVQSFRIGHLLGRKPGEISGGERQRTALARSLVTHPRLLLLDEPLSALDHATQSRIIEDLRVWNAAREIPILYVTHSHREVFALGEQVVVLHDGKVLADGRPQDVLDTPAHELLAQLAGFENFFDASVLTRRPDNGTMRCRLEGGAELEVPLGRAQEGQDVRIAVRAADILIATDKPSGLSARNVLQGSIAAIQREGTTVVLMVNSGGTFQVHVTPVACESLGLSAGQPVWLVIKTHSCRIVSRRLADA